MATFQSDMEHEARNIGRRAGWGYAPVEKSGPRNPPRNETRAAELERYRSSESSFEQFLADRADRTHWFTPRSGTRLILRSEELQQLLSWLVINPMGYRPNEQGVYGWGELAAIYQTTPTVDISRQAKRWREAGDVLKANLAEQFYGGTMRAPEPGTSQSGQYPLRGPGGGLAVLYPQLRTGQKDVRLDPGLVARLTTERPMQRAQKRRYKGGTKVAGALSTIELGQRKLGG